MITHEMKCVWSMAVGLWWLLSCKSEALPLLPSLTLSLSLSPSPPTAYCLPYSLLPSLSLTLLPSFLPPILPLPSLSPSLLLPPLLHLSPPPSLSPSFSSLPPSLSPSLPSSLPPSLPLSCSDAEKAYLYSLNILADIMTILEKFRFDPGVISEVFGVIACLANLSDFVEALGNNGVHRQVHINLMGS